MAGLINALKLTGKKIEEVKIVTSGAGAAGIAIIKLLLSMGAKHVIMTDREGAIYKGRENLNPIKMEMAEITNLAMEREVFLMLSKMRMSLSVFPHREP